MVTLHEPQFDTVPFPHFSCSQVFDKGLDRELLNWFKATDLWSLTKTDFYTQYEFSLLDCTLPQQLQALASKKTIGLIIQSFKEKFDVDSLDLVGLTAHKLIDGHRMGVHNDFIGKDESHRLIIQLNEHWTQQNGGFLMLFGSNDPNDVAKVVQPLHNSGVGFEISPLSYHAVSTIHNFLRYTLVYTFNKN